MAERDIYFFNTAYENMHEVGSKLCRDQDAAAALPRLYSMAEKHALQSVMYVATINTVISYKQKISKF